MKDFINGYFSCVDGSVSDPDSSPYQGAVRGGTRRKCMGTRHGHIYADGTWVGWASYIEEPFGHTLKARVCFMQPDVSRRWDSFVMQVTIKAEGIQYLRCSNIRRTGSSTVGGQVWSEYLISYEEEAPEATSPLSTEPPKNPVR